MAAVNEGTNQLAALAKSAASAKAAAPQHRGRWQHHIGNETVDESLEVYYCAFCGAHSLILDVLISELPTRSSDRARVVQLTKHAAQLLLDEGPCVKLKRAPATAGGPALIEKQYRYLCKGCGLPLAYLSYPFKDKTSNKLLYLIEDAFALTNDGKTKEQLEAEEAAKREEMQAPIVIPKFNVTKPSAAALAKRDAEMGVSAAADAKRDSTAAAAVRSEDSAAASTGDSQPAATTPAADSSSAAAAPSSASTVGVKRDREE